MSNELSLDSLEQVSGGASGVYTYEVREGDTLIGIARKYRTTPDAIYNLNQHVISDPNNLVPGTILKIQ